MRVNAGKIKIMICGIGLDLLQGSGEFPCAICLTGVGRTCNDYACEDCMEEVQGTAACSFIPPPLLQDLRSCVQLMRMERNAP